MAEMKFLCAYHSYLDSMELLNDEERGRLFTAMLTYSKTGESPQLKGNERFVFPEMRAQIDRDREKYDKRCKRNAENIKKRWGDTTAYDGIRPYTNDTNAKAKANAKANAKAISLEDIFQ